MFGETSQNPRLRVALVQGMLAHFRKALFQRMDQSESLEITFFTCGHDVDGIVHLPEGTVTRQRIAPVRSWHGLYWQRGIVPLAFSREFDVLVLMGNPHYLSAWIAAAVARLRGLPVLFWTHGWLRRESGAKRLLRLAFYRLANRLLLYSERGRAIGIAEGYPAERMTVIYNSLDVEHADEIVSRIEAGQIVLDPPSALFPSPGRPLLICTARLTPNCRFDLLLEAAALLKAEGMPVNVLLVGNGPMRSELEAMARGLEIDVHFAGSVFDEELVGYWHYHSDLTVSPGKVGLTAMLSLMYGTPVITHGNLDEQLPEVEAVVQGKTGDLFRQGDAGDLASALAQWLGAEKDRAVVRADCRAIVHGKWNPAKQAACFEEGIRAVMLGHD